MRHDPVDILTGQPGLFQRGMGCFGELFYSVAENLLAMHAEFSRDAGRDAAIDVKQILEAAIGMQVGRQQAAVG